MLNRRAVLLGMGSLLGTVHPLAAQDDAATRSVIRQLEEQGFTVTEVSRTFLGRVRVVSQRGRLIREIVFDPRNGAVLRDFTEGAGPTIRGAPDDDDDDDDNGAGGGTAGGGPENGGGRGGDDDDDDDDGGDDDDDDGDDDDGDDDDDDGDDDDGDDDDDD
ncbi:MAG: hypothetical protein AAF376_15410 [Pseudomonadota bacterium]